MKKLVLSTAFVLLSLAAPAQGFADREAYYRELLRQMTPEEKAYLLMGDGGVPRLGVPEFGMDDGARGPHTWEGSTGFPCGLGQSSAWNPELMFRAGQVMGEEARALGKTVLLGPGVNILRDPLGGRFFEYYTEDPYLNGAMAVPMVQGLQSMGVAACLKHYACNNRESNRNFYYSVVDERTLHEIYLPVYKAAVQKGHVWTIMTSANGINFEYVSDSRKMLTDILKDQWGFDGFVMTDWLQTRTTEKAISAGLDKSMPGWEDCLYGRALLQALKKGTVRESFMDDKVLRILRICDRVGLLEGSPAKVPADCKVLTPEHVAVAREMAQESIVLLKNEGGLLPLDPGKVRRILVTGPNATLRTCEIAMGGSSWMYSPGEVTILDGLRKTYRKVDWFDWKSLGGFREIEAPVHARYYKKGLEEPAVERTEDGINFMWEMRSPDASIPVQEWTEARFDFTFTAPADGKYTFRFTSGGGHVSAYNGSWEGAPVVFIRGDQKIAGTPMGTVDLKKGQDYHLCIVFEKTEGDASLHVEYSTPESEGAPARLAALEKAARKADAVIFVGGLDMNLDTEGRDRITMLFPQLQQEAILRLVKANPRTVVTLMNGSPVELGGWLPEAPAVLEAWYGGIEAGTAVADIISGKVNPSGHLTFTWPKHYEDTPIRRLGWENQDLIYFTDSLNVGYRYYDSKGVEPEFPFGHGLSYTSFDYGNLRLEKEGDAAFRGTLTVRNTGSRSGKEVVQVYIRPLEPSVERPVHELKAFCKVEVPSGGSAEATFTLEPDAFSIYDVMLPGWRVDPGRYVIEIGRDSRHIELTETVVVK